MEYLLCAEHISKQYANQWALSDLSLQIPKGSIFGLLGQNGAGKTTFIRIINQIIFPDKGKIIFDGIPLQPKHIAQIGYLPEERGLYKNMKVGEQALYLAQLKGLSKRKAEERLKFWFEKLEISQWWNKKVQELSKGMAQKIQFMVTVLHEPKLLIFDEPFSGFDPISANLIKDEIRYLKEKGATIIFSTHRMESVEELCDHIALIHQSEKILDGKLTDIKKQYRNNSFRIGIKTENKKLLLTELENTFSVKETQFNSIYDDLKIILQKKEQQSTNELLQFLSTKGEITLFEEVIPTVNDIFINTIKNSQSSN